MKKVCSLLLALILVTLSVSVCFADATDQVTLYYYGWTDEESYMSKLIAMFEEANPDIHIEASFINHDDHNQRVVVMASTNGVDMDLVSCDSQAMVLNLVSLEALMPLSSYIAEAQMDLSAFGPIINETSFENEYYGLPYRSTLYSLYYNKTLFDKLGLAYPEKITWDEYLELAAKMTYVEDGTQYWGGFLADWLNAPLSMYQRNSNLLDDDLSSMSEWLEICNKALNVDKSHMGFAQQSAESIDWLKFFCLGTTGMLINGEWTISMIKDYVSQGIDVPDWDVTYLPTFDVNGDVVSPGGLSTFIVMGKNTKHPAEAFRFVQFLSSEEASVYLASQGVLPAYSSDAVKASFAEAAGVPGAATLLGTTISLEAPSVAGYSELATAFGEERKLYLTEQETLEELNTNMVERREEILSSY